MGTGPLDQLADQPGESASGHADKPTVTFAPPSDPDTVSHELTIRVPDCRAAYDMLTARGAVFLTPPVDWGAEIRCCFRDPDGHLLEISEVTGGAC